MNSFSVLDETLVNLRIIAALQKGDRLRVQNNIQHCAIEIDHPTAFQGVIRRYQGDSREKSLMACFGVFEQARLLLHAALQRASDAHARRQCVEEMVLICEALTQASQGIPNLADTYQEDAKIQAIATRLMQKGQQMVLDYTEHVATLRPVAVLISQELEAEIMAGRPVAAAAAEVGSLLLPGPDGAAKANRGSAGTKR